MYRQEQYENIREAFRGALSRQIDVKQIHTTKTLSDATGIGEGTIRDYKAGRSVPEWASMVALMKALPPDFAEAVLAPTGLGGVQRIKEVEMSGRSIAERLANRLTALLAALTDRRVDHRETKQLSPEFRSCGVEMIEFAKALDDGAVEEQFH